MKLATLLCIFGLFLSFPTIGQKASLRKANQLFKEDKYAAAIPHYKKALTRKDNSATKAKLAYCYKITNQIEKAIPLYKELTQEERVKSKIMRYYAETLMSQGNYDDAKIWFEKYAAIEEEEEMILQKIRACEFAKTIKPYFNNIKVQPFLQNSEEDDNAPVFWNKGIVFTSDRKGKLKFLDTKSGTTDRNYLRLYYSKQLTDSTFSKPVEYISKINHARKNTGMASFQPNGTRLVFTRNGSHLSKKNAYCLQLFELTSTNGENWKKPSLLPFCRKESNYMHPSISPDGKLLFFVSDKPGGMGGTDIYVSKKKGNKWGKPENLGTNINTEAHEGFPFFHQNNKLYFCSKGHLGLGGFDVFVTELKDDGTWTSPTNLGTPINSPADDISIFINADLTKGLFTSSREGGDDDIFIVNFSIAAENTLADSLMTQDTISSATNDRDIENRDSVSYVNLAADSSFIEIDTATLVKVSPKVYMLPSMQFQEGQYSITQEMTDILDQLAIFLENLPQLKIEVAAHTSNLADYSYKMLLTQNRANAIAKYLFDKGIPQNQLVAIGYGGQYPLNDCRIDIDCTLKEHAINERIEIKIFDR